MVVTFGGVGLLPKAPGTWGSAVTIPVAWALHWLGGFWLVGPFTALVIWLGWVETGRYLKGPDDDPAEVVIDEVAGMLIALWPLSLGLTLAGAQAHVFPWPGWVLGFLAFRFLDIVKPWPVGWADRLPGATGVMLDDILAGIISAMLGVLAAGVAHGWF